MCVCPSSILNTTTNRSKFCNKLTTNQTWSLLLSLKCFLRCSSLGFGKISFTCTLITREVQARHDLLYGHGVHLRAFQYLLYISDIVRTRFKLSRYLSYTFQAFRYLPSTLKACLIISDICFCLLYHAPSLSASAPSPAAGHCSGPSLLPLELPFWP